MNNIVVFLTFQKAASRSSSEENCLGTMIQFNLKKNSVCKENFKYVLELLLILSVEILTMILYRKLFMEQINISIHVVVVINI